ncbi:MAG: Smr/MutS family protein [Candidatus Azobacteroides sp.]|nr:Smr/MutS family protein [Candidatus Azobacteroides sp.]
MVYPDNFEQKIEFDKIRLLIKEKCISVLGKEKVDSMRFSSEFDEILTGLNRTEEFVRIIQEEDTFPVDYFYDCRAGLKKIRVEGTYLDEPELFDLRRSLETIREIVRFLHIDDEEPVYKALAELAGDVVVFPQITAKIEVILDKYGRIKDNASPELAHIRQDLTKTLNGISKSLTGILRAAQAEGLVDKDVAPSIRDGRLVIPVSPAFKRKIKGIVHDESASGKTVFIEPAEVVEANNRVRELENEERREIIRILVHFSDTLRPFIDDILQSYEFLAEIDFIRAKALFGIQVNAIKPVIQNKQQMDWVEAVHPLLWLSLQKQSKKVVPLEIILSEDQRILIISGPNAGGKSICLKTAGLLQYMLQCGLLIPLKENSKTGVFEKIFIDIGDEQSIENDLSTYSSHLTNMKFFIRNGNSKTLLLIDEFGGGTEPQIGGAIAEAVLKRFNHNQSYGIITTHYQNLKHFAEENEGIVNGAMLYDRHLMQPLFKLSIGNPGSSFAIEIARKIGLPEDVIADASEKVGENYINMDKYLQDIVRDKRYWESKRQSIRQKEKHLEELTGRYDKNISEIEKQHKEIIAKAKAESLQLISDTNAKIENTIRRIREVQAEKEQTKNIRSELETFKSNLLSEETSTVKIPNNRLNKKRKADQKKEEQKSAVFRPEVMEAGDYVRLEGQSTVGQIIEIRGKSALVTFGMLKSTIKLDKLEKISKNRMNRETPKNTFISEQTADEMYQRKLNFKQEIDVRGMRGNDALQAVMYFIDDALLVGVSQVRILHGTGTGALRQVIREYLQTVPGVNHFHDEHVQFGGAGITVVEM